MNRTEKGFIATTEASARTVATIKSGRFWSLTCNQVAAEANAPDGSSTRTVSSFVPSSTPSSSVATGTWMLVSPAGMVTVAGIDISPAMSTPSLTVRSSVKAEL